MYLLFTYICMQTIHSELNVSPKEVLDYEFAVFADLDFNLYVPLCEFMPHFNRLIRALGMRKRYTEKSFLF